MVVVPAVGICGWDGIGVVFLARTVFFRAVLIAIGIFGCHGVVVLAKWWSKFTCGRRTEHLIKYTGSSMNTGVNLFKIAQLHSVCSFIKASLLSLHRT